MAKAIRATPMLRGKEAVNFVKQMIKRDKSRPTKSDLSIVKALKKEAKFFHSIS